MSRTVIRGGWVVSMDPRVGNLRGGEVLIDGDKIVEVGAKVNAEGAEVLDATGCIVIPGLINAHQHTWQTGLRGAAANWTILEYFHHMHAGLATKFRPDDLYIAKIGRAHV